VSFFRILRAFLRRDWAKARSYRLAFASQLIGVFFELSLFFFLGRIVDKADFTSSSSLDRGYFSFVVIGTTLLQLVTYNLLTFSSTIGSEQGTGSLEAVLATPPPPIQLLITGSAFAFIQLVITQLLTLGVAALFFGLRIDHGIIPILTALLTLIATVFFFGSVGLVVAAFTLVYKQGASSFVGFGTSILGLVGGVYYPLDVLPRPLRLVGEVLPFTWALAVFRAALIDGEVLTGRLILLVLASAVAVPIGVVCFRIGLDRARRDGSLGQY
jgi:ABC-2 type transport system permease protein